MRAFVVSLGLACAACPGLSASPSRLATPQTPRVDPAAAAEHDPPAPCELASENPAELPNPDTRITRVRVNQVGYRRQGPKRGQLADGSTSRLPWVLRDHNGQVIARGKTWVLGADAGSGEHVHEADFSCVERKGFGYRLQIDAHASPPFAIADHVFADLRTEAFGFFYRHRSGVRIEAAYAGEDWPLPEGHPGDADVPCSPRAPCDYRTNASRGWYGDGAMGKYTVGSALAVWTLHNLYEHHATRGADAAILGDNLLATPEAGNSLPDVLDVARWHLEWMLAVQVPEGQMRSNLVHHQLHGEAPVAIGTAPHEDRTARALLAPTTFAALNLAAVAAQAARLWKTLDPKFAQRCLAAAERAYVAARVNELQYADESDSAGGRLYLDGDISDEAYWASVELALTTGKQEYVDFATASPHHLRAPPDTRVGMPPLLYWDFTQGLATVDLALVGGPFAADDVERARALLRDVADAYVLASGSDGYRTTLRKQALGPDTTEDLLHNAMVLELVFQWTQLPRYRIASIATMDWLLGRNPLGRAYVTGFGANPVEHPHHLYWSVNPPPGLLVSGPNGQLDDPVAAARLQGCAPQKCYVDDAAASSTNRVSDHANAALAWMAASLAE